jgi:DNA-binding FrmR family transcriptional regulator
MAMKHEEALQRMKTIQGHLNGVTRMIEDEEYCIDIIRQVQAVQSALNKVSKIVLDDHMKSCMVTVVDGEDPAERERVFMEISEVFDMANKT